MSHSRIYNNSLQLFWHNHQAHPLLTTILTQNIKPHSCCCLLSRIGFPWRNQPLVQSSIFIQYSSESITKNVCWEIVVFVQITHFYLCSLFEGRTFIVFMSLINVLNLHLVFPFICATLVSSNIFSCWSIHFSFKFYQIYFCDILNASLFCDYLFTVFIFFIVP